MRGITCVACLEIPGQAFADQACTDLFEGFPIGFRVANLSSYECPPMFVS